MQQLKRGVLIAVEGIDGSGKSTLARHLLQRLTQKKFEVILTKEPGGTQLGQQLRAILQQQPVPIADKAEYLLFAADRAQHMHELIGPALEQHKIVISDRMGDSSVAYQGYGRGLDIDMIKTINAWALNTRMPDVTIYVTLDAQTARKRLIARGKPLTAFEAEEKEFTQRIVQGFETIMRNRDNVIIVDGIQSEQQMATTTFDALQTWIKQNNLL